MASVTSAKSAKSTGNGAGSCEVCHNSYDKMLHVELEGVTHSFDCFECAIFAMAPQCKHCGVRVVGHGLQARDQLFCCANCARQEGVDDLRDRA